MWLLKSPASQCGVAACSLADRGSRAEPGLLFRAIQEPEAHTPPPAYATTPRRGRRGRGLRTCGSSGSEGGNESKVGASSQSRSADCTWRSRAPGEWVITCPRRDGSTLDAQRLQICETNCSETTPSVLPVSSSSDKAVRGSHCRKSGTLLPWMVPVARSSGDLLHDKAPHVRPLAQEGRVSENEIGRAHV